MLTDDMDFRDTRAVNPTHPAPLAAALLLAAAARALGRPRALVLRWCRDLGLDPLAFR